MTWPLLNRSESLNVDYFYLQRQVGDKMGFTHNPAAWDDEQTQVAQEVIDEGCRTYYFPPPLSPPYIASPTHLVHEWSFMRPIWQFSTAANTRYYPVPENFDRPIGPISFRAGNTDYYDPIRFTSTQRTLELENRQNYTGPPQLASIEPLDSQGGTAPQTLQLTLHPTPDSVYELQLQYQAHARRLSSDNPHPLGGQVHAMGVLAACLAVAEMRMTSGAQGPAWQTFMQRLAGNIARDEQRGAAILGYNGNGLMGMAGRGSARAMDGVYYDNALYGNTSYFGV